MISVCIATYNGAQYLRPQIESIVKQLGVSDEVIVSDDCSTDDTVEILRSFNDPRIRVLTGGQFRSATFNFENALKHAHGDFIFLSDQDDIWLDGKVNAMMEALYTADLVTSDCRIVDAHLNTISPSYLATVNGRTGFMRNLVRTSSYMGCCMAFRKNVLQRCLPFPKRIENHDYWIAMVAEAFYRTRVLNEPLLLYRRHGLNASNTGGKSDKNLYEKLIKRFHIVSGLLRRF